MADFSVRALSQTDAQSLAHFLSLAAQEEDAASAMANPELARYVEDWGRAGDCGVAALNAQGALIGLAWARLWTQENQGFGFVDELTPEMAIAVAQNFRGQGVGSALIEALKCRLRALKLAARWDARNQKMVPPDREVEVEQPDMEISPAFVSLSVRADSPTIAFYRKCGFEPVEGSEQTNRVGEISQIWRAPLGEGGHWRSGEMDRSVNTNWAGAPDDFVSINFYYNLQFSLFDAQDRERFYALMGSLPGREAAEHWDYMEGVDEKTSWMFFGPSPVKAAIHWSHLGVWIDGDLHVFGDLKWEQWCQWDEAFSWPARGLPHSLKQDEAPELRELRASLHLLRESLMRGGEENRKMRLRLRQLGDHDFG